jgi:hypothetical protein
LTDIDVSAFVLLDQAHVHRAFVVIRTIVVGETALENPFVVARVQYTQVIRAGIVVRTVGILLTARRRRRRRLTYIDVVAIVGDAHVRRALVLVVTILVHQTASDYGIDVARARLQITLFDGTLVRVVAVAVVVTATRDGRERASVGYLRTHVESARVLIVAFLVEMTTDDVRHEVTLVVRAVAEIIRAYVRVVALPIADAAIFDL